MAAKIDVWGCGGKYPVMTVVAKGSKGLNLPSSRSWICLLSFSISGFGLSR